MKLFEGFGYLEKKKKKNPFQKLTKLRCGGFNNTRLIA